MFISLLWTSRAIAGPPEPLYTFTIAGTAAQTTCNKVDGAAPKPGATVAFVKVVVPPGVTLTFTLDGAAVTPVVTGNGGLYEVTLVPGKENTLVVTPSGGAPACDGVRFAKAVEEETADALDLGAYQAFDKTTLQAQLEKLKKTKGLPRGTKFLVHLPSGQPTFPFAASYTEGDTVQIVTIAPTKAPRTLELDVSDCGTVNTFRTDLTTTDDDKKQSEDLTHRFVLMPVGQYFSCGSGTATYTLKTHVAKGGTADVIATTKLNFRPKFHIAAIAVLGWDKAHRRTFTTETESGATTATVVERHEKIGRAVYLGGLWMIGGVDYEHMRWWNYFLNLWIAADPASPTKDFAVGLAVTPTGGASLAIGVSFHENQALEGLHAGDPFMGDGKLPTHDSWSGVDPGLLVGVSVDSRVYDAIIKRFSK